MQVGVLGVNHKSATVDLREKFSMICNRRLSTESSLHGGHILVPIVTCNRMEVYFSSNNLAKTHSYILHIFRRELGAEGLDHLLYAYFGENCFTHLARVTAGLDSAVVGETEIQGQVKKAYELARKYQDLPQVVHFTFQKSLKIGKKIRSEVYDLCVVPSMERIILDLVKETLINPKILFVGASQINLKVLKYFNSKGNFDISLTNRSEKNAKTMTEGEVVTLVPWLDFKEDLDRYNLFIFGTKFPGYLLTKSSFSSEMSLSSLIIDLSVPRNVDPEVTDISSVTLWNIDQVSQKVEEMRSNRLDQTSWAERTVELSIERQVKSFMKKIKPCSLIAAEA